MWPGATHGTTINNIHVGITSVNMLRSMFPEYYTWLSSGTENSFIIELKGNVLFGFVNSNQYGLKSI